MATRRKSSKLNTLNTSYNPQTKYFLREALEPAQSVGEHRRIDQDGLVYIWHQDSQDCKLKRSLLDTGTWENFISRSVQEELNLSIVKLSPMSFKGLGGHSVEVQDSVQPEWCFYDSSTRRQQFKFNVVPCIPGNRDIVIGSIAMTEMGIYLVKDGSALVIHEDLEGSFYPFSSRRPGLIVNLTACIELPAHERRQLQRRTRDRDTTITQTKIRQQFEARQADLVRQTEAAAKASSHTKSEGSSSQRDPAGSENGQRQ